MFAYNLLLLNLTISDNIWVSFCRVQCFTTSIELRHFELTKKKQHAHTHAYINKPIAVYKYIAYYNIRTITQPYAICDHQIPKNKPPRTTVYWSWQVNNNFSFVIQYLIYEFLHDTRYESGLEKIKWKTRKKMGKENSRRKIKNTNTPGTVFAIP